MNKIYKLVWSKVRNTWVVASEIAKGHGKNASATRERKLLKTAVITAIMGGCLMTGGLASAELTPEQKVVYEAVMAELEKGGGVHYFSVKSKDQMPNYNKDGAKGETSVAIGPGSTTKFRNGLSVGTNNLNEGYETTVVGSLNKAYGMGDFKYAKGATIVGTGNTIMSNSGILAMGSENIVHEGIAIGTGNNSMGENAVALGNFSSAMYTDSIGIGFGTHGDADAVIAIGRAAKGDALGGVAIGRYAEVHASTGVALGESSISERKAGVIGYMPGAVGQTAEEVAAYLGKAEEYKSWKEDREANQEAYDKYKAWQKAASAERQAFKEINEARIAYAKKPTEENKKAITEKQEAWKKASDHRQETDVAARPYFKTINDLSARYGQIFGKLMSTEGAVSVGDEKTGRTRQIINVAAGTQDTDAVNVYQLKALATAPMGFDVGGKVDENNVYTPGAKNWTMPLSGLRMSFGDGLLAEEVTDKDGKKYTLVKMNDELTIGKDGKDGKIKINSKDGKSAEITVGQGEDGVDGTNGQNGITRIIYNDKENKTHEVATLDDGLKFKGDNDDVVIRKLNTQLKIEGGAKADELSANNIGVVGTAGDNGGLAVKLSKKLKDLTSAEFVDGDNITNITGGNISITKKVDGNKTTKNIDLWDLSTTVEGNTTNINTINGKITDLTTQVQKAGVHYLSVNSSEQGAGSNYKNDGAKGNGAVAIGEKAMAAKGGTVSIGRNAHIEGNGGNPDGEGSVAIGDNSLITTNGLDLASIAIGKNAKVLNGSGKQERGLSFTPDNFDKPGFFGRGNTLPKNADKVPGGIAIGTNSYARTGSIQLGHHTFAGYKMGGIDVTNANEEANIVGMTTVGTNTYNKGALANMYGAYSIITGDFTGAGGTNSWTYGPQNFGANVVGSLNSIRSKGHSGSSGVANSIVGVANTVENANGTLVYGAGNKITNSIKHISPEAGFTTLKSWEDTVTGLQKVIKDSKSGGAVLAIGGGNVADYVRHSQLVGVNNTVTGTENKVSDFNMVNGYQNTGTNITHVTMTGSENTATDSESTLIMGDKQKVTKIKHGVLLGSQDTEKETIVSDVVAVGHNAYVEKEGGIALGSGSIASIDKGVFGYDPLTGKASTETSAIWKATQAAFSVGSTGDTNNLITRQITGVAAGSEDTDAVNVAQLKVVNDKADKNATNITNLTKTVNANGKATKVTVDGKEENADGNLKITKKTKDGQTTYDLSLNDELTIGKDGKDGKIGINGKDGKSAEITVGKGEPGVDGKDGVTRIIYKDKDNKNHEVATLDDGLKFKGDNDDVVIRKLNTQLNIEGGAKADELSDNNIGVVGTAGDNGGMKVKLSKKLKGLTSAEFVDGDKVTNITAQTITQKDGDNITNITGGNVTITRKEGNTNKTVDLWELNNTVNNITQGTTDVSSWKLQANGAKERTIKKGSVVNFKNGEKTAVTVKGNDITVDLNEATKKQISDNTTNITNIDKRVTSIENNIDQKIEGSKIKVEGDTDTGVKAEAVTDGNKVTGYKVSLEKKVKVGNVTIDGTDKKGEITGLTNKTLDSDDFATKGRAATEEQLKAAMGQAVAQGTTTVKAGDQNISVVKTENKNEYTVKLAKDITVDNVTAKTVKADEYKVGDKTYINKDGINANGNKITNVGDGKISKDSTDAVNGKQLYGVEQKVNQNTTNINKLQNNIYDMGMKVGELDTRVNRVGAGAAALAALHPLDFDPDDKWDFAAGYGNYKGANAAAIGAYYRPNEDTMFSVGGSFGGGENMVNAGVSVKFGQGNHVSTSKVAMAKDMLAMQKRMAEMEAQMAKMQGFIGALTGMDTQTAMFPDVPENHWAYEYVKGLCEQGIIDGYPDGNFNGNRSMTRYEFAAMLYRALAKGVSLDARAVKEFAPELGRIRVDVISQNKEGQPVIERVRVNEEKKDK